MDLTKTRATVLAASCVALNLVAAKIAALLSLPVYLDTVGTILGAALLPWPFALGVAALTSLLGGVVIHPSFPFYMGTQVVIALIALYAMRLGAFERLWSSVVAGVVIAIGAAVMSAPVTVVVFGGVNMPGTTAINAVLLASGKSLWESVVSGGLFVEAMDKPATAIVAFLVLRQLPNRMRAAGARFKA